MEKETKEKAQTTKTSKVYLQRFYTIIIIRGLNRYGDEISKTYHLLPEEKALENPYTADLLSRMCEPVKKLQSSLHQFDIPQSIEYTDIGLASLNLNVSDVLSDFEKTYVELLFTGGVYYDHRLKGIEMKQFSEFLKEKNRHLFECTKEADKTGVFPPEGLLLTEQTKQKYTQMKDTTYVNLGTCVFQCGMSYINYSAIRDKISKGSYMCPFQPSYHWK